MWRLKCLVVETNDIFTILPCRKHDFCRVLFLEDGEQIVERHSEQT